LIRKVKKKADKVKIGCACALSKRIPRAFYLLRSFTDYRREKG